MGGNMKAAVFHEYGGPDVVRIEDVARPEAGPGEVLIQVQAAALNHLDLWVRRGLLGDIPMPHIGGSDIAGQVAAVGPGVDQVEPGTRIVVNPSLWCGSCEWCSRGQESLCVDYGIIGAHTPGGLAEYAVVPAGNVLALPEGFPYAEAAASVLVFLTAWRGLIGRAELQAGEDVLVTGASGGVGTAAVQVALMAGARVFAVSTGDNMERCKNLGARVVYDRADGDYADKLLRDTNQRGVDVVFDAGGQTTWRKNLRSLARGGRLVVYGATTGPAAETDLRQLFRKQLKVIGTTMSSRGEFERVMALVCRGDLKPIMDAVWPLQRAQRAHERLERGDHFGKIVLVP